ncbi:MAG: DUF1330 domain-containing protein [Pseudomonadota bacterium]
MAHYALVTLHVTDAEGLDVYKSKAGPAVAKHGGRPLAGGPGSKVLQSSVSPMQGVVLEFPTAEAVTAWLEDDEFAEVHAQREASADVTILSLPPFPA